jgi:hypothetical protein
MSLKFAALGDLNLRPPGTPARAEERDRNLEPVGPYEPILVTFGWRNSATEPKKPETGAMKRFVVRARQAFASR